MSNQPTLVCWHAVRAGIGVLEGALGRFASNGTQIERVLYLTQRDEPFEPPPSLKGATIEPLELPLPDPTDHVAIRRVLEQHVLPRIARHTQLHVNISPGTPAMHAVWLILHAGGALPDTAQVWASQRSRESRRTSLTPVKIPITTYLREVRAFVRERTGDANPAMYAPGSGESPRRLEALELLHRYARVGDIPLFVVGERGTGKSHLVESAVRVARDPTRAFVTLPCGGMNSATFDSLLFGHAKGAFTDAKSDRPGLIAQAEGGTLFLDEVHDMPADAQRKLVRVLQERWYRRVGEDTERKANVHVVCASNKTIAQVRERLDPDLFDRICHLVVEIPPLRECREDLETDWQNVWQALPVADGFRTTQAPANSALFEALLAHPLPGNFRDLQRLAALVAAWTDGNDIDTAIARALEQWRRWTDPTHGMPDPTHADDGRTRDERIADYSRELAEWAHLRWGTWEAAAEALDCSTRTLRRDRGA